MIITPIKPRKALNKAYLKVKPNRNEIEAFKVNLLHLIDQIDDTKDEEYHKTEVRDFLKSTYYKDKYYVNVKKNIDWAIFNGPKSSDSVGVLIETKKPGNKSEMVTLEDINKKALQELVLYYLRERITAKNKEVRHIIATNIFEWFIFDAQVFDKVFAENKKLVKEFTEFEEGRLAGTSTDFFYKNIAEPFISEHLNELSFTHFDLREYDNILRNKDKKDDTKLIALYKLLSPEHLLKLPFTNDSNSLDKAFYSELLHLIGLSETKEGSKKIIGRKPEGKRDAGSLLENTIVQLDSMDVISGLRNAGHFGSTYQERLFNVALELVITWINRILFLKLLEAQLISYHKGDTSYAFLNSQKVKNFDDLNTLFFSVLARKPESRIDNVKNAFAHVPYLNSSLFERSDIEAQSIVISNLRDELTMPILSSTVLKDSNGNRRKGDLNAIEYIFEFLNAYDFSSEGSEEIQEENKSLINASVLGLIFEKINGYKDGSFFTPGFITMYMCRETIRRAVLQKFNEAKEWNCKDIVDLHNKIEDKKEANKIINSLKICDPAVGSGHFLVSALNEIIAIKNELKILMDRTGMTLRDYHVEVVNDELVITDDDGRLFEYHPENKASQRIQEALFHEKQLIIENCLFGVDINPNSVKICRLRLWIELLKHAYYVQEETLKTNSPVCYLDSDELREGYEFPSIGQLQTLPNIDINIKCGNSLISRFDLDADISQALKKSKWNIDTYRTAVQTYREARSKEEKREMERLIEDIKKDFETEIAKNDKRVLRLNKVKGELFNLTNQQSLFGMSDKEKKAWEKQVEKLTKTADKLESEIEEIKSNQIYENAFEWRFEFPEVLDGEGNFVGFDVVIGNPPYIRQEELKEFKSQFKSVFTTYSGTADIYVFFIERGFSIMKHNGHFTFIMPNKFMQAGYGKPARQFLLNHDLVEIIDFGDFQVFEEATTYPCILSAKKCHPSNKLLTLSISTLDFPDGFSKYVFSNESEIKQESLSDETWVVSNEVDQALLIKINSICKPLHKFLVGEANYGIKTGLSEAFFISEETKQQIIESDPKSHELIKPLLRGRDVAPWYSKSENSYLIGTFPSLNIEIDNYVGVKRHLESFGIKRLEQSGEEGSRKKTSGKWFETQDTITYWQEFEKPKIMYQVFQVKPCFIYDEEGMYCNNSMWILPTEDKVLLGILNSKLGWWLISKYCTAIQNGYQLIWKYFSQIPIAKANEDQSKIITSKVDEILSLKKQNPTADTSALENEIDIMVYKLYDLTYDEVKIVDPEFAMSEEEYGKFKI